MTEYIKIYMYEYQFSSVSTSKLTLFEDFDADSRGGGQGFYLVK